MLEVSKYKGIERWFNPFFYILSILTQVKFQNSLTLASPF
ncbi:hypothetical protein B879_00299 [Cecembia lonarensis LW9]|uniref:Uncharacterized protein n=1 Tax=Cecembia lonarensis (strain CCUG 58316 / KCTC 22772 / LW9) TaxID=1225176 RepID=K1LFN0_CECL9|nr:hypothetical protein B879_00299 [Cecembia lonarensis LW9]